jgi:GH24 family phage-related lysozyme (muramidase)
LTPLPRRINAAGLSLVQHFEDISLAAYLDPAGIPTIGWGHTPAEMGQTITFAMANMILLGDLAQAEATVVAATVLSTTTDNQFSAMVSLCFNIGRAAFLSSTVLRMHRSGTFPNAAEAFLMWNRAHIDGRLKILAGLTKRRELERSLYLDGTG